MTEGLTHWHVDRDGTRAARAAVVIVILAAGALSMLAPSASALTEYRYELVIAPPTPLDYKGVAWAPDGDEALVVGGIQAVLDYADGMAIQVDGANWTTPSQTIEEVAYGPDGTGWVCGGRINGSRMEGHVWRVTAAGIEHVAGIGGDLLTAISVSASGRVVAVGSLGGVYEVAGGAVRQLARASDAVLNDVAWSPDGSGALIVGTPGVLRWLDAATGALSTVQFTSTNALQAVGWRPGTATAWAAGEGGIVVEYNATSASASRVRPSTPRAPALYGVSWNSDGDRALLVGAEGTTLLWRLGVFTTQSVDVSADLLDAAWSPTADEALVSGSDGTVLRYAPRLPDQDQPPTAVIASPGNGDVFEEGATITFDGSGSSDPEGETLSYEWSSNASGPIGTGAVVLASLPVGEHRVTLLVDDGNGNNATDVVSVRVEVVAPPPQVVSVQLLSPLAGAVVKGTLDVTGRATATQGQVAIVQVRFDDGPWATAQGTDPFTLRLDTRALADALHEVRALATTTDGATGEANAVFEVRNGPDAPPAPEVPNVTIRLTGRAAIDEVVRFEAVGVDPSVWEVVWSFGDGSRSEGLEAYHAYGEKGTYQVAVILYRQGEDYPAASFTASLVVEDATAGGMSLETLAVLGVLAVTGIYLLGFYAGRRFGRGR
jgi:hypothetical protein